MKYLIKFFTIIFLFFLTSLIIFSRTYVEFLSLNSIGIFSTIFFIILDEKLNKILEKLENIEKLSDENKFNEEDNDVNN